MLGRSKSKPGDSELEKAINSIPRSKGPLEILILNNQGLPVMHYDRDEGVSATIDEMQSALSTELVRGIYDRIQNIREEDLERAAFFFEDSILTVEKDDPFIFLITWPRGVIKVSNTIDSNYLKRIGRTLHEELT